MRFLKLLGVAIPLAGLLVACSDDDPQDSVDESVTATSTTVRPDDGVLVVGAIVPRTGVAAELGVSMGAALTLAITEINAAGGIDGIDVQLIQRDEGENESTASQAMLELLDLDVDAIIGPTSSINTLATLGNAVDAGVLMCSPTASALALDSFPDEGLFIRTIASDSLQAEAIAAVVESSGTSETVIVFVDDNFGRPFAQAARVAALAEGTAVTAMVGFTASEDRIASAAAEVAATGTGVVIVIADGTSGPAIISAIDDASGTSPTFVVNDAIRRPASAAQPFRRGLNERVVGVAPIAYPSSESFLESLRAVDSAATGLFAHTAYDCLNIIALGAQAAASDNPAAIARQIANVTDQGTPCGNFAACKAALEEGRLFDYSGPVRDLVIGTNGEVLTATFERFTFDAEGRDIATGFVTVGG